MACICTRCQQASAGTITRQAAAAAAGSWTSAPADVHPALLANPRIRGPCPGAHLLTPRTRRYEREGYTEQRGSYYGYERDPGYSYEQRGSYPGYPDSRAYSDRTYMDREGGSRSRAPGGEGMYDRGAAAYPPGYSGRTATGPDRSRYGGARPTPYERAPGMRSSERGPAP